MDVCEEATGRGPQCEREFVKRQEVVVCVSAMDHRRRKTVRVCLIVFSARRAAAAIESAACCLCI